MHTAPVGGGRPSDLARGVQPVRRSTRGRDHTPARCHPSKAPPAGNPGAEAEFREGDGAIFVEHHGSIEERMGTGSVLLHGAQCSERSGRFSALTFDDGAAPPGFVGLNAPAASHVLDCGGEERRRVAIITPRSVHTVRRQR